MENLGLVRRGNHTLARQTSHSRRGDITTMGNLPTIKPRFSISARSEADQEVVDVREKAKIVRKA